MHRQTTVVGLALAAAAMMACSSGSSSNGTTAPSGGRSTTVVASSTTVGGAYGSGGNFFFSPTPDTVSAGTAVTFKFGSVAHNVHFDAVPNAPDSIATMSDGSMQRTFTTAGTFNYHCTIHGFSGVMIVQ